MALNFFDLTNELLRKVNEAKLTSSQFDTAAGFHASAKDFINYAIQDINQTSWEWPFNHKEHAEVLVAGKNHYSLPSDLRVVDWDTFFVQKDNSLDVYAAPLGLMSYDIWANSSRHIDENSGTEGRDFPKFVIPAYDDAFIVSPIPDKAYTVKFQYWATDTELVNKTDTTNIPDRFKNVIMERALWWAYTFRSDLESASIMNEKYEKSISDMRNQLLRRHLRAYSGIETVGRRGVY